MNQAKRVRFAIVLRFMGMTGTAACYAASLLVIFLIGGCGSDGGSTFQVDTGRRASDPEINGTRDMNYDHLIVPGDRIGPVKMGGAVSEAVRHLGKPDRINRSTFRGPGYSADEVYYFYDDECIRFTWQDTGIEPVIESGFRGINVTCGKWKTSTGLHVGSSMSEVNSKIGAYCASTHPDGDLVIMTKEGIWYWTKDRNSPVNQISVEPVTNNWGGACKD